jgi:hypothetical protein
VSLPVYSALFRLLAERCESELGIARSTLHRAVGIAVMARRLPASASGFRELPVSHQAALLPLAAHPLRVETLASRAKADGLTVRQVTELVSEEKARAGRDPRGRQPKPEVLKSLEAVERAVKGALRPLKPRRQDLRGLSPRQHQQLIQTARRVLSEIERLALVVRRLIDRLEASTY